jgi:hypothetical protein
MGVRFLVVKQTHQADLLHVTAIILRKLIEVVFGADDWLFPATIKQTFNCMLKDFQKGQKALKHKI